jgi:protein-S-isoprenylcysteine O-methyltransferase Ste14
MAKFIQLYLVIGFFLFNFAFGYLNHRFRRNEPPIVKREPSFWILGTIRFLLLLIWFVVFFLAEGYKHKLFGSQLDSAGVVTILELIGLVLFTLGGILILWSRACLGEWFATRLVTKKGQRVIQEGPYKFVRHPIYVGGTLALWGLTLALNSLVTLLILAIPFPIFLYVVARVEEKLLVSTFKGEYQEYQSKVSMFVPGVKKS